MNYDVFSEINGVTCRAGAVVKKPNGYRFIPATPAHKPSRRDYQTPKAAIPRWVGKCQIVERVAEGK